MNNVSNQTLYIVVAGLVVLGIFFLLPSGRRDEPARELPVVSDDYDFYDEDTLEDEELVVHNTLTAYRNAYEREIFFSPLEIKREKARIAAMEEEERNRAEQQRLLEEERRRIEMIRDREERRAQELRRLQRLGQLGRTEDVDARRELASRLRRHALRAIVFSDREKYALIGDEILVVDQVFDGFEVYHIEAERVTVKSGDEIFFLRLPGFQAGERVVEDNQVGEEVEHADEN